MNNKIYQDRAKQFMPFDALKILDEDCDYFGDNEKNIKINEQENNNSRDMENTIY